MIDNDFCAKKMLDVTNKAKRELENKEFQDVVDKITAAAKNGLTKVEITFAYETTRITLEHLGFQIKAVNYITNYNSSGENYHTCYEASWDL